MEENDLILGPADLIPSHSLFYFESSFVSDMLPVSVVLATKAVCHESVGLGGWMEQRGNHAHTVDKTICKLGSRSTQV